ncbi:MAG: tetratricopeptide repeat protein, partial [Planctomycetota bacterium]
MERPDHYARGLELYHRGLYERALSELEPLTAQKNLVGRVARYYQGMSHRALGVEALRKGQFAIAEQHLRVTIDSIGRSSDLSHYLASLYAQTRRYRNCANELEKSTENKADNATAYRRLALGQWRAGRREQAYMTLTEGLRKLANSSQLHLQLGLFHAAENQYTEARESLMSAVEADCDNPDAHYYLALAEAAAGNILPAVRSFQRAFELQPSDLMAAYQLALAAGAAEEAEYRVTLRLPEPLAPVAGSEIRQLAG